MTPELIAFVGGGQMAGSLLGGLLAAGHPAARLRVAEPDAARADVLRRQYGVEVLARGADVAAGAEALVLAVKPQVMREALAGVAPAAGTTVISIAAGLRIDTLRGWLGGSAAPIVRAMPNTPALLRAGVTGLHAPRQAPERSRQLAARVLGAVGTVCWIEREELLDAVTALSGSGPAYFFLVAEALRDAGVGLGLDAATAALLAQQTLAGAGRLAEASGKDLAELRIDVTSKGGTTEAALARLEDGDLRGLFVDALKSANARARQLGDELGAMGN